MPNELTTEPTPVGVAEMEEPGPTPVRHEASDVPETDSPSRSSGRLGSVFWTSVGVSAVFVVWAVFFTENLSTVTTSSR